MDPRNVATKRWTTITASVFVALVLGAPLAGGVGLDLAGFERADGLPDALGLLPGMNGDELWAQQYDAGGHDRAHAVAVRPDGLLVYVTGQSPGSGNDDFATIAYEALTGLPVWEARYDGDVGGHDRAFGVAVDPAGERVFVTGASLGGAGTGIATVAYDALTGVEQWTAHHPAVGTGQNEAGGVVVSPDGEQVYVTGTTGSWASSRITTVAYDAATGDEAWSSHYGAGESNARDIVLAPDGSAVYVTGWTLAAAPDDFDYATVAYDAQTGSQLWASLYDGPGSWYDFARGIAVAPEGESVYVTGGSIGDGTSFDVTTVAYDAATGAAIWVDRYDGPRSTSDNGWDVAAGPDGTVYVTGISFGLTSGLDQVTIATDGTTGDRLWLARYDGPANASDFGEAITVSADGNRVFTVGYALNSGTSFDYVTLGYEAATGTQEWASLHDGPASAGDFPAAIAADPLGLRVYVTGRSAATTGDDYGTVAYLGR